MENSDQDQRDYKNLLAQSWVTSSFEKDRSILTVSSAGIGLLIALANAFPIKNELTLVIFIIALLSFTLSVGFAIWIFSENKKIVISALYPEKGKAGLGKILDRLLVTTFLMGLSLSSILAFLFAVDSYKGYKKERKYMSDKDEILHESIANSLDGISQFNPQASGEKVIKSLDGIDAFAPPPNAQQPTTESSDSSTESNQSSSKE